MHFTAKIIMGTIIAIQIVGSLCKDTKTIESCIAEISIAILEIMCLSINGFWSA